MMAEKIKRLFPAICLVSAVTIFGCPKRNNSNSVSENDTTVIAYYFYRTVRCAGCLEIEANAKRVIEENFANHIAAEKLTWAPFNLDEPGGDEFGKEFDVSMSTLVLSKEKNGNHTEYKKLEKVWQLAHDTEAFNTYVKDEVKQFLNEQLAN